MSVTRILKSGAAVVGAAVLMAAVATGAPVRAIPRPEPVAETRLVMEGLTHANFQGLERHLKAKPPDADTWTFIRGQALLIGESGNLLLMRPPRNKGEEAWMDRATDLRDAATALARAAANRDYDRCKIGLTAMANVCNRCHQTFRVPVRLTPFAAPEDRAD